MARKAGPLLMPDAVSHARQARTGQVAGCEPYGSPMVVDTPSWSVLELWISSRSPSSSSVMSSTVERDELAAAESAGETHQQQRAVTNIGQAVAEGSNHRRDELGSGGFHLARGDSMASADP